MKKRCTITGLGAGLAAALAAGLALSIPLLCWGQGQTQGNRVKGSATPVKETQVVNPMSRTQGEPGQRMEDQAVVYRFHLASAESRSDLVVTNTSAVEEVFRLVAQGAEGGLAHERTITVGPGETLRIPSAEAHWSASGRVSIKTSRRLRLSLHPPDGSKPTAIKLPASAATYDVFSLERDWEVGLRGAKGRVDLFSSGRKFSTSITGAESLQRAVLELWNTKGSDGKRGLFVAYTAK